MRAGKKRPPSEANKEIVSDKASKQQKNKNIMQIVKFKLENSDSILAACERLENGKRKMNEGKKEAETAKAYLSGLLAAERQIDVSQLAIGETVCVQIDGQDAFKVTIGSAMRLDQFTLAIHEPEIVSRFTKKFPVICFDVPLIPDIIMGLRNRIKRGLARASASVEKVG